jgi:hypothetical protein
MEMEAYVSDNAWKTSQMTEYSGKQETHSIPLKLALHHIDHRTDLPEHRGNHKDSCFFRDC